MYESRKILVEHALLISRVQSQTQANPGLIAARLPLFGTAGSVIAIGFINKRMLALGKAL